MFIKFTKKEKTMTYRNNNILIDGHTVAEIAQILGKSKQSVYAKILRLRQQGVQPTIEILQTNYSGRPRKEI